MDPRFNRDGTRLTRKELLAGAGATAAMATMPRSASAAGLASIAKMLGVDPKHAGTGMSFDVGCSYPVTGPAAIFGAHVTDIPRMAF